MFAATGHASTAPHEGKEEWEERESEGGNAVREGGRELGRAERKGGDDNAGKEGR